MHSEFFIHPNDAKALKAMKAIPAFGLVTKKLNDIFVERGNKLMNLSSRLKISERQLPEIYNMLPPICAKLEIPVPELYLENNPEVNAYTKGDKTPCIVLTSGLITHCSQDVIRTIMAHECGHIVCHHVLYKTMVGFMMDVGTSMLNLPFVTFALEYAMLYWDRCSEYSADRAAAYVCGGPDPVVEAMMELACGSSTIVDKIDKDEFLRQAKEYKQYSDESKWNKFMMYYNLVDMDHPFLADRASDIVEWCNSKEFLSIDAPGPVVASYTDALPDPTVDVDNGDADIGDTSADADIGADISDNANAPAAAGTAAGAFKKAFAGAKKFAGKGVEKITGASEPVEDDVVEDTGADAVCPNCGGNIKTIDKVCSSCGVKLIHCPNCDAISTEEDHFCDKCGTKLN